MTRLILVLACLAALALALYGMRVGWRHRAERQAGLPPLPAPPVEPGPLLLGPITGLYVGTVRAGSWQDRIVARGLGRRAAVTLTVRTDGLLLDRDGDDPVYVPSAALEGATLGAGLAGKVVGAGGLLVVRWRHDDDLLDSGFRADDKSSYPAVVRAIDAQLAAR